MKLGELKGIVVGICSDLANSEAEADWMYNDVEVMHDLIGHRVYAESNLDDLICEMLDEGGIFSQVAERIIERM
jgi:hypothetical protein